MFHPMLISVGQTPPSKPLKTIRPSCVPLLKRTLQVSSCLASNGLMSLKMSFSLECVTFESFEWSFVAVLSLWVLLRWIVLCMIFGDSRVHVSEVSSIIKVWFILNMSSEITSSAGLLFILEIVPCSSASQCL